MKERILAGRTIGEIGLGCMNLSHAYGTPPDRKAGLTLLRRALDLGVTHFDTAALYGFGRNELLVGEAFAPDRDRIHLASKCGISFEDGKRKIDGRPETLRKACEASLERLRTDHIDIYYLHRWDKSMPIEESVGGLSRLVEEGKIGAIGLSEVSAPTLRRAHAEHPIGALQTEYSLWTRNPEVAVLDTCRELGTTFVAFSPLTRGFFAGGLRDLSILQEGDIRNSMPRFQEPHFSRNLELLDAFDEIVRETGLAASQILLGWLLAQGDDIIPIPGTSSIAHLEENVVTGRSDFPPALAKRLDEWIRTESVSGNRYSDQANRQVDTEPVET